MKKLNVARELAMSAPRQRLACVQRKTAAPIRVGIIAWIVIALVMITLTGCGGSVGEPRETAENRDPGFQPTRRWDPGFQSTSGAIGEPLETAELEEAAREAAEEARRLAEQTAREAEQAARELDGTGTVDDDGDTLGDEQDGLDDLLAAIEEPRRLAEEAAREAERDNRLTQQEDGTSATDVKTTETTETTARSSSQVKGRLPDHCEQDVSSWGRLIDQEKAKELGTYQCYYWLVQSNDEQTWCIVKSFLVNPPQTIADAEEFWTKKYLDQYWEAKRQTHHKCRSDGRLPHATCKPCY